MRQVTKIRLFYCCRLCVRFAWIVWKTWSSCVDTALAKCAAIVCRSVQYVAKRSTSAFCSTKNKKSKKLASATLRWNRAITIRWANYIIYDYLRHFIREKNWLISFWRLFLTRLYWAESIEQYCFKKTWPSYIKLKNNIRDISDSHI